MIRLNTLYLKVTLAVSQNLRNLFVDDSLWYLKMNDGTLYDLDNGKLDNK